MSSTATENPDLKVKLADIERALSDARDRRAVAARAAEASRDAFAKSKDLRAGSPAFNRAQADRDALKVVENEITELQQAQVAVLKMLGKEPDTGDALAVTPGPASPALAGWDARNVLGEPTRQLLSNYAASTMPAGGRVPLGQIIERDALAASLGTFGGSPVAATVGGTDSMRRGTFIGVAPQLRRPLSILDLIPTSTMDGKSVPYTQESGSFDTAAETAEGALKPEAAITLTDKEAVAATIPTWLKVFKQTLADAPGLRAVLENRLRYAVMRRLQSSVLAGSGTGANLTGILNTSGIGTVAYDGDELVGDQVLRGIAAVHQAEGQPNAIVMNPADWSDALIAKASGDGHYFSGGPFAVTAEQMWSTPLIPSTAMPQGTVLVGDFAMGAQLFIREGVHVLLSDSDQDDFLRNVVTLLAEMRAALAVFRPQVFCTVDIAA
jgi:hypothetical protein